MSQNDPIRVLLVEDNEDDAVNIRYLLRLKAIHTYELDWASTYDEGREKIFANRYDVALFDYRLGGKNGIDLLRECREKDYRLPIILLTGAESLEIDLEASSAGAADYLDKNTLDTSRLERAIRYSMKQHSTLEALRESQRRLELFMKHVPAAIGIKDNDGRYLFVNDAFQKMVGVAPEDCVGKTDGDLSPDNDTSPSTELEKEIFRTGTATQSTEPVLHHEDGHYWLASRFPMIPADGPPLIGLAAVDITERVRAEERLKQTTQLLNGVLTNLPVIAGRIDPDGKITEVQGQGLKRFTRKPEEWIGSNLLEQMPQFSQQISRALNGGAVTFLVESRQDGEALFLETHFFFDQAREGGAIFFSHDITSQKVLEQELLRISEEEQQRLGRDLHDGLGQQLTGVALLSSTLHSRLTKACPDEANQAKVITEHVQEAIAQTRALSRGLCPVHLEKYGLQSAIEGMAHNIKNLYGVDCSFICDTETQIHNRRAATHLYRIAQEATNNALKHGDANRITITLELSEDQNCLTVEDNGKGFFLDKDSPGMGLRLMDYRSSIIGGSLEVTAKEGEGTIVKCSFPNLPEVAPSPAEHSSPTETTT